MDAAADAEAERHQEQQRQRRCRWSWRRQQKYCFAVLAEPRNAIRQQYCKSLFAVTDLCVLKLLRKLHWILFRNLLLPKIAAIWNYLFRIKH